MADKRSAADWDRTLRVFNLFIQTARVVEKDADRYMHEVAGISTSKFVALMVLSMSEGTMTSAKLAEATGTKPHNITLLVDRMERDGLVTTERQAADRRYVHVKLTDNGRAVLDRGVPGAHEIVSRTMASLGGADLSALERMLAVLKQNVTAARLGALSN